MSKEFKKYKNPKGEIIEAIFFASYGWFLVQFGKEGSKMRFVVNKENFIKKINKLKLQEVL